MSHPDTTIVLAHGILGFGELFGLPLPVEYFNGVAHHLRAQGFDVIAPQVQTIGSVAARGDALRSAILNVPVSNHVHILAHSMGGLDARSALARHRDVVDRVTTLVTIGTPHAGSPVADAVVKGTGPLFDRIARLPQPIFEMLQANAGGLEDLTIAAAIQFNAATPDADVRYIEVAGDASRGGHELFLFRLAAAVGELHGVNDGVVTRDSALREGHEHLPDWPVDHAGETGWTTRTALRLPPDWHAHLARYDALLAECVG